MQFFEYKDGEIIPLIYPMTSRKPDETTCFLVYAKDINDAETAVHKHLNENKPLTDLKNFRLNHEVTYQAVPNVAVND